MAAPNTSPSSKTTLGGHGPEHRTQRRELGRVEPGEEFRVGLGGRGEGLTAVAAGGGQLDELAPPVLGNRPYRLAPAATPTICPARSDTCLRRAAGWSVRSKVV
jgi:hypothetical protein